MKQSARRQRVNMRNIYKLEPVRIPVKLVAGKWEYFYGGGLPIDNGAVGDLLIDKDSIKDQEFLLKLKRGSKHKILEAGTELLVALTIKKPDLVDKQLDATLAAYLLSAHDKKLLLGDAYYFTTRSPDTRFVKIRIAGPTKRQKQRDPAEKGGVWLHLQGLQPKGVSSSTVSLPEGVSEVAVESLNHAFTLLSEKYEPWRKAHTGNIYERMLYKELNEKWYPLNVLRNATIASDEHQLIRDQWTSICEKIRRTSVIGLL